MFGRTNIRPVKNGLNLPHNVDQFRLCSASSIFTEIQFHYLPNISATSRKIKFLLKLFSEKFCQYDLNDVKEDY